MLKPQKEMVRAQQQEPIDAAKKAELIAEAIPALKTSQKKHSVESSKARMIKEQKKVTYKAIKNAEAVNFALDVKPAATN